MDDQSAVIAEFCAITGAAPHIAENYLGAHDWDIGRASDFYFEHPPDSLDDQHAAVQQAQAAGALGGPAVPGVQEDFIEIPDDDDQASLAALARQREAGIAAREEAAREMDGLLGMADEVVRRSAEGAFPPGLLDVEGRSLAAGHSGGPFPEADPGAAAGPSGLGSYGGAAPPPGAAPAELPYGGADMSFDLPEGIDAEEARMLEAAMLGVPYEGRIPDFSNQREAAPLSPGAAERRAQMVQQDLEYEESLAADRAKMESIRDAELREQEEERQRQEAEAAAAAAAAEAGRRLEQSLTRKRMNLAPEPPSGTEGAVTLVIRLPDGSRKGRRFVQSDALQNVFDFVDVECGAPGGAEGVVKPGGYNLVTQFPRRVFKDGTAGSLADAGVMTDTALFLELL